MSRCVVYVCVVASTSAKTIGDEADFSGRNSARAIFYVRAPILPSYKSTVYFNGFLTLKKGHIPETSVRPELLVNDILRRVTLGTRMH